MTRRKPPFPFSTSPTASSNQLQAEITALRALIHRVSGKAADTESLPRLLHILDGFGRACTQLANLLKTERILNPPEDISQIILQAADDLRRDLEQQNLQDPAGTGIPTSATLALPVARRETHPAGSSEPALREP